MPGARWVAGGQGLWACTCPRVHRADRPATTKPPWPSATPAPPPRRPPAPPFPAAPPQAGGGRRGRRHRGPGGAPLGRAQDEARRGAAGGAAGGDGCGRQRWAGPGIPKQLPSNSSGQGSCGRSQRPPHGKLQKQSAGSSQASVPASPIRCPASHNTPTRRCRRGAGRGRGGAAPPPPPRVRWAQKGPPIMVSPLSLPFACCAASACANAHGRAMLGSIQVSAAHGWRARGSVVGLGQLAAGRWPSLRRLHSQFVPATLVPSSTPCVQAAGRRRRHGGRGAGRAHVGQARGAARGGGEAGGWGCACMQLQGNRR